MSFKFQRTQCIEIDVPAGNTATKFVFPDQPQLTGNAGLPVIIDSIEAFTSSNLPYSPITFQNTIDPIYVKLGFLTLYQGDLATFNALPLSKLVNTADVDGANYGNTGVVNQPLTRNLINVSWTKSFVQFATAPTGATKIVFCVYYTVLASREDVLTYLQNQNN